MKTKSIPEAQRKHVKFHMAILTVDLMQDCFPKHLLILTARINTDRNRRTMQAEKMTVERSRNKKSQRHSHSLGLPYLGAATPQSSG